MSLQLLFSLCADADVVESVLYGFTPYGPQRPTNERTKGRWQGLDTGPPSVQLLKVLVRVSKRCCVFVLPLHFQLCKA